MIRKLGMIKKLLFEPSLHNLRPLNDTVRFSSFAAVQRAVYHVQKGRATMRYR